MTLQSRLARELARRHPHRAAAVLDRLAMDDVLPALERGESESASDVLSHMSPQHAAGALTRLEEERALELVTGLDLDVASRLLRRVSEPRRSTLIERLPRRAERALRSLLRFAENTAGALMDTEVLALAEDLTASEALARVREMPDQAHYNLYVVDRDHVLVGAFNLRELFLAEPERRLTDLMIRDPLRLDVDADRSLIVSHRGWREVHSLPVVDAQGRYLGAVRYRTLQRLQEDLLRGSTADADTAEALGDLFATGASSLLEALGGGIAPRGGS